MNRFTKAIGTAMNKALTGALIFASAILPSAGAFVPQRAYADTATVGQTYSFDTPGSFTFTVPSNVTQIRIDAWGAGGAGGNGTTISGVSYAGQGGGAGGYAGSINYVTGNTSIGFTVGQGGSQPSSRTGGSSFFDGLVAATGGNGGANWDEIPGNGPSTPPPAAAATSCFFEGTWVYDDEGSGNDFGVTCRSQKVTAICPITGPDNLGRGFHANDYICERGNTPASGIACQYEGTWGINDDGGGNDFALTCRNQQVTGWCTHNTNIPRGFNPGNYQCEQGQAYAGAPICDFEGTWTYNDDGSGNDFSATCHDWKMAGWCGEAPSMLPRGQHPSSYTCELPPSAWTVPPSSNDGGTIYHGGGRPGTDVEELLFNGFQTVLAFFSPLQAYAQAVFDGRGGHGTVGADLRSGGDAAPVTAGPNSAPTSGGGGYNLIGAGGNGSANGTGSNGANGRILVTVLSTTSVVPGDASPTGVVDSGSCSAISGWAYDPDVPASSIDVHFYADGPAGSGTFLGAATANQSRPDVNSAMGVTGNHGFTFNTPDSLKDNGTHYIYAYGINSVVTFPSNNAQLISAAPISVSGCTVVVNPGIPTLDAVSISVSTTSVSLPAGSSAPILIGMSSVATVSNNGTLANHGLEKRFNGGAWQNAGAWPTPLANVAQATDASFLNASVNAAGTYEFRAYASLDNANYVYSSPATVIVTAGPVNPVNSAPTAPAVTGPTVGTTSQAYTFAATATDADGDNVRYGFDWDNNGTIDEYTPFGASGASQSLSHAFSPAASYTFQVYAEDTGARRSTPTAFTIVISNVVGPVNQAPSVVMVAGPTTGLVNVSYSFTAAGNDPEGQALEYAFDWNNNGVIDNGEAWGSPVVILGQLQTSLTRSNVWTVPGIQNFNIYARDTMGAVSNPFPFQITITGGSSNIGFTLTNTTGLSTSEAGATATFDVTLDSAPLANVTMPVISTDTTEGTVSTSLLTFTPANWNVPQAILVSGVDDTVTDGNIGYSVLVGTTTSADVNFNNLPIQSVNLINYDNEQTVTPPPSGGGGGGGGSGQCRGFGCPALPNGTTTPDVLIYFDAPVSGPSTPTAPRYCLVDDFIADYSRIGAENNPNEVRKLQYFLNSYENAGLAVDGVFGSSTEAAVMAFQAKYADAVLAPWGTTVPTGIVYITTRAQINKIYCTDNPTYREGDLTDIFDGVLYPPANPDDFQGVIGSTEATSTNIAGVFGAITQDIMDFLGDIPWYPLLVTLLVLVGAGLMIQGIFKDMSLKDNLLAFTQGSATFALGSVLNVLNTVSYMISPERLLAYAGVDTSWLLALVLINLLAVVAILIALMVAISRRLAKDEPRPVASAK